MAFKVFATIAAILAGTAVAAGAFGAHILAKTLGDRALAIFETGVRYQMYHALALLLVALLLAATPLSPSYLQAAGMGFIAGAILFSGSLYALSLSGVKWLGAIAPLGGLAFLVGWACLAIAVWHASAS